MADPWDVELEYEMEETLEYGEADFVVVDDE